MSEALATSAPAGGLLDRDRSVAGPNFNRGLVPPAVLAIHLCIGMGYGFSVFWLLWLGAGIAGLFLIAAVRQAQINAGVAHNLVHDRTYIGGAAVRGTRLQSAGAPRESQALHER